MADTKLVFYGFWHLSGETVTVSILGLDCGTAVVSEEGSVTISYGADSGGLLTPAYLIANSNSVASVENNVTFNVTDSGSPTSVTVPVVIGLPYTTKGQLLRPDVQADIKSPAGSGLGKTRRLHQFAMLLQNAVELKVGTDFSDTLMVQTFTNSPNETFAEDAPFTGVHLGYVDCEYDFNGQLCWQVDGPYPCTVSSVTVWLGFAER